VGDRQRPNCEAIRIAALESVDWSRVDLSEWGTESTGALDIGALPDASAADAT